MEHPGLDVHQIKKELTLEEMQEKIKKISVRLSFAYRMMNQPLINQLEMVMETYNRAYMETLQKTFGSDGNNSAGKIDIS